MPSSNNNKNSRGKRGGANQRRRGRSHGNLRAMLHGASFRVRNDPPATVDRPWNTVTLLIPLTTNGNVTLAAVNTAFNAQVGTTTTPPNFLYRFLELRAWELSGGSLAISLLDLQSGNDTADIRTQTDQPGRNHWSCVGMKWPVTQQNDSVPSTNATKNLFVVESGTTTTLRVLVHLNILWRFAGTPGPVKREVAETVSYSEFNNLRAV